MENEFKEKLRWNPSSMPRDISEEAFPLLRIRTTPAPGKEGLGGFSTEKPPHHGNWLSIMGSDRRTTLECKRATLGGHKRCIAHDKF